MNIGLSSHNFKNQVASDVPIHGQYIDNTNLKTQEYLNSINEWTINQKMVISEKKTKSMIINFNKNTKFTTRITLNEKNIEIVNKMKILGIIITDDLNWDDNCSHIIAKVNKRMLLIKKMYSFGATIEEMTHLWITYCRSVLEQSSVVWNSSLTQENKEDLERTQKSFVKLVLRNEYRTENDESYENSLMKLNLETLESRRNHLDLNFAKNCIKNEKFTNLFPPNENLHTMETRHHENFKVYHANTERFKKSSIINMQNLLNIEAKETSK